MSAVTQTGEFELCFQDVDRYQEQIIDCVATQFILMTGYLEFHQNFVVFYCMTSYRRALTDLQDISRIHSNTQELTQESAQKPSSTLAPKFNFQHSSHNQSPISYSFIRALIMCRYLGSPFCALVFLQNLFVFIHCSCIHYSLHRCLKQAPLLIILL